MLAGGRLSAQLPFAPLPFYGDYYLHDPSALVRQGTNYFVFGDGQGILGITSSDLRNWTATSTVFPPNSPPAWTTNAVTGITNFTGYFWAPDVAYFNGQYNLYYACSDWGTINSAIGLVTTPSLISPVWTDQGKVIQSNPDFATNADTDLTAFNCIDPCVMVDTNGTVWMSFGSYSDGILIMQLNPATGKRFSASSPIYRVANNGPVFFSSTEEGSCLYQHGGYYYLFANWGGCCDGVDSTYNIRVGRSTNVSGPYFDKRGINLTNAGGTLVLESSARYIGPGQAGILDDNGTNWFTYHYYDGLNYGTATVGLTQLYWTADGWPAVTNDWSAFYPFNVDAREHLGLYDGTLQSGAVITNDSGRGNVLALNGAGPYARLANPVANASTFAAWVKWSGGTNWQRIFDFGAGTGAYLFLTPAGSDGNLRFSITTNGIGGEQHLEAATPLPTNSWCHVAVTLDGSTGLLYLDGSPVATNLNLTIRPWQLLATSNYLGKSQFPGDPTFNGRISSFRVFSRALAAAEITNIMEAQPQLAHRYSFNTNAATPAWDSIGMAHGALMGSARTTNNTLVLNGATGGYVNLPPGLVSGSSAVTMECWATFGVNGNWARIVDFGNISGGSGQQYFFYSPHTSTGGQRLQMSTSSTITDDISGTLDNRSVLVTCIVDPTNKYAAVYTNGVLESAYTASWPAFNSVSTAWSFLGHSLFSSDAYLNATIDELRIYDGRLTPAQIAADNQFGPGALALPVSLTQTNQASGLSLSWPSYAVGFAPQDTPALAPAAWTNLPASPVLSNDLWQIAVGATNSAQFFRLRR